MECRWHATLLPKYENNILSVCVYLSLSPFIDKYTSCKLLYTMTFFLQSSENPCNPLPSPLNGAMVCDTWLYGRFCQMQCTDKFDIPYGVAGTNGGSFTGAYTCSDLQGTFTPSNVVANCTGK